MQSTSIRIFHPLVNAHAGRTQQAAFGLAKRSKLPGYCQECPVRFTCNGGCPKNRILITPDGEPGLNWLCAGYRSFFTYIDRPMRIMASLLKVHCPPAQIMAMLSRGELKLDPIPKKKKPRHS
ncbi:MAG: SPASM domain-containing protein [Anaerolineales bacterium]|nr:SPASM domain-containing protein [Anaerolineales bacterium]